MASVLGVEVSTIRTNLPIQEVSCGSAFFFVPMTTRAVVDQAPRRPRSRVADRQQPGVNMGRPSRIHIRVAGTPDNITDVKVGGASVLVGDGRITRLA